MVEKNYKISFKIKQNLNAYQIENYDIKTLNENSNNLMKYCIKFELTINKGSIYNFFFFFCVLVTHEKFVYR